MGSIILIENWIKDFNFLFDSEFQIEYINPAFRMIVRCTMFCFNLRYLINDCKKHDKIFFFCFGCYVIYLEKRDRTQVVVNINADINAQWLEIP